MAKEYHQRPSHLLGIADDDYTAYCLDEACFLWGSHVEGELEEAGANAKKPEEAKRKRQMKFKQLLTPRNEEGVQEAPKQYRDPAEMLKKKGG